jgi:hypothetical protein
MFNGTYPSRTKPSSGLRGASVDLVGQHVTLHDGAICNPSRPGIDPPFPPPKTLPWIATWGDTTGVTAIAGKFVIVDSNLHEYHYDLP